MASDEDPYAKIRVDKNKCDDNVVCDICLDDEDEEGDEIVICEMCLAATHQKCYGSELKDSVPKGEWFCARCTHLRENPKKKCEDVKCMFCPDLEGIIKQINKGSKRNDKAMWAHIICVNWIPEINFKNDSNENIEGTIPQDRFRL